MTTDDEDRSTWPRNGRVIRRAELLRLIEENGGPRGLDLRGAVFVGEGKTSYQWENPIDLSPEALAPLAAAHGQANGGSHPPWLATTAGINLWGARLQGAHLFDAQLQGAYLEDAQLQDAILTQAQLQRAVLWGAQLQGAALAGAQLERVDMYSVDSLEGARWHGALLAHTLIKRESLGRAIDDELEAHKEKKPQAYHDAKEAYLLLKNNFNQIGRYEDASWAYVKEQQMEKMAYYWEWRGDPWDRLWGQPPPHKWQVWPAWSPFWRWLRNWAYELATGYGERPWNPVIGGVLIVLGFALGFTRAIGNFWDALIYSLATFATFNLADTGPTGRGADVASSVEALLGISVLALVIFTIGNRMSRG